MKNPLSSSRFSTRARINSPVIRGGILLISILVLIAGSFSCGVLWYRYKLFPYQQVAVTFSKLRSTFLGAADDSRGRISEQHLETTFSDLRAEYFYLEDFVDVEEGGGGIHALGNQVFIVDNHGNLFLYTRGDGQKSVQKLPTRVDSNFDAFKSYLYSRVTDEFRRWEAEVWFRFNDILYREESGRSELLLSHQYWHEEKECASLRVSRLDLGDWDPQTPVKLTRS